MVMTAWLHSFDGIFAEDFEGASSGTTISTSNTAFTSIFGSGTAAFDSSLAATGSQSAKVTSNGTGGNYLQMTDNFGSSQAVVYVRCAFYLTALSSSNLVIGMTTGNGANMRINIAGNMAIMNNGSAVATTTNTVPLNTWFAVEWCVNSTATTQTLKLYSTTSGSPLETISGTYSQGTFTSTAVGIVSTNNTTIWIDSVACSFAHWIGTPN